MLRQDAVYRSAVVVVTKADEKKGKPQFWERVSRILDGTDLSPTQRLTLLVIMIHEGDNEFAFPSQTTLARRVGVGERQIRKLLPRLESDGFILTKHRPGQTELIRVNWARFATNPGTTGPGYETDTPELEAQGTPEPQFLPTPELEARGPRNHSSYESKENIKVNTKSKEQGCTEPVETDSVPADSVMEFPTTGKVKKWGLTQAKIDEWQATFDTLDVLAECRKARQWILDNPAKRKTARGMVPFLGRWLSRSVDSGRGGASKPATGTPDHSGLHAFLDGKRKRGFNEPDHSGLMEWYNEAEAKDSEQMGIEGDSVIETSGKRLQ